MTTVLSRQVSDATRRLLWWFIILTFTFVISGCEPPSINSNQDLPASALKPLPLATPAPLTLALWQQQQQQIEAALTKAEHLHQSIAELLHSPKDTQLEASRAAWHDAVLATESLSTIAQLAKKQAHPTWQALAHQFSRVAAWPSRLGYLDDNGIHGATGLIFDIDTPISAEEIRRQHQLTGEYDLTTGLYPIGHLLMGYGASRDAEVFTAIDALNDALRVKGFEHIQEVPSNRRRQLIELQSTLLLEDMRIIRDLWQATQSHSPLNAFSQKHADEQRNELRVAALDMVTNQLSELHEQADMPLWQAEEMSAHALTVRVLRWQSQLEGAIGWLNALGEDTSALQSLRTQLPQMLPIEEPPVLTNASEHASETSSSSDNLTVSQESVLRTSHFEALYAEAILALKPRQQGSTSSDIAEDVEHSDAQ